MCVLVACYCNVKLEDTVIGLKITTAALGLSVTGFALLGGGLPLALCLGPELNSSLDCPLPLVAILLGAYLAILLVEYTGFAVPFLCQGAVAGLLVYETRTVYMSSSSTNITRNASEVSNASKATLVAGSAMAILSVAFVVVLNCLWLRVARRAHEPEQEPLFYDKR